ncbi:hypothetical protein ACOZ38_19885 [Sphaerisporangium viridialbum]|uniref:hypothetical protein n=1 Tax=Sphaerisporangium viridialbum TaxID=46189 RepID=UPI003C7754ED
MPALVEHAAALQEVPERLAGEAAVRDRDQAVEARRVAEQMARDAEADKERQVRAAWREAAEQRASEQTAAAIHAPWRPSAASMSAPTSWRPPTTLDKQLAATKASAAAATQHAEDVRADAAR